MYPQEKLAVLDIETNLAHDKIWMAGVYLPETGTSIACYTLTELHVALKDTHTIVGHNIIGFDLPVLERVWGFMWYGGVADTYVMGRMVNPSIEGGHSLRAWAERAGGELKDDFTDYDGGLCDEMVAYCLQDCKANWDVFNHIRPLLADYSEQSVLNEHEVARITKQQEANGFAFNFYRAAELYRNQTGEMHEISKKLQTVFPPIVTERYSTKLKDKEGNPKRLKDHVQEFNVGSRQQIASRLNAKGAVWTRETPNGKPVVDEGSLQDNQHIPEAAIILQYLTLQKRSAMVKSWLDACAEDGRIHGRVNTCGAVTNRMTHSSPNLAQIPSDSEYRECFTVPTGSKLVGIDASGLELRMLAHYMGDDEYTQLILHDDIHTYNQQAAGLDTRPQAKTFIYAFLYGAGDAKIGAITGGGAKEGAKLKATFLSSLPALGRLLTRVQRIAADKGSLPGLDGRRILVRSEHAALNTLLQSAGAIVMKHALVLAVKRLDADGLPYKLVAQVHDEFQVEVPEAYADDVGRVFRDAIIDAGEKLNMRCPLDGEYKIGNTWADTH